MTEHIVGENPTETPIPPELMSASELVHAINAKRVGARMFIELFGKRMRHRTRVLAMSKGFWLGDEAVEVHGYESPRLVPAQIPEGKDLHEFIRDELSTLELHVAMKLGFLSLDQVPEELRVKWLEEASRDKCASLDEAVTTEMMRSVTEMFVGGQQDKIAESTNT